MITYEFKEEDEMWVMKFQSGKEMTAGDFLLSAAHFFRITMETSEKPTAPYVFGYAVDAHIMRYSQYINYGKDKSGKVSPAPDFFRSFINIALDNMQSAAYMIAYRKACETLDPKDAKDAKEIEKRAAQAVVDLSMHLSGKPNLFK